MTTTSLHDVPVPAGYSADTWQATAPIPNRVLLGDLQAIDGLDVDRVSVQVTAVQLSDGRIDDGSLYEAPKVYLGDDGLSATLARAMAATLIAAADEADQLMSVPVSVPGPTLPQ